MARFAFHQTPEPFDWKIQAPIGAKVIRKLASERNLAELESILLLGPPGVGKAHREIPGVLCCRGGTAELLEEAATG